MRVRNLNHLCIVLVVMSTIGSAVAQHNWARTITVDPMQGAADHQTIAAAINDNRIGNDPSDRYTVLIYAGEYAENVALGRSKENVDLVGIDPDAVIIKPSSGDGITITAGGEAARNNSKAAGSDKQGISAPEVQELRVANTKIKTANGHGIEIVKPTGGSAPKYILLHDLTIHAGDRDSYAIRAPGEQKAPGGQRIRIADLMLYEESTSSNTSGAQQKP